MGLRAAKAFENLLPRFSRRECLSYSGGREEALEKLIGFLGAGSGVALFLRDLGFGPGLGLGFS